MKTLKQFFNQLKRKPLFLGAFNDSEHVFNSFAKDVDDSIKICYAAYEMDGYEGSAVVFYYNKKDKKFYEIYGSHCSCYGLEESWKDDGSEVNFKELENRLENGYLYDAGEFKRVWLEFKNK